MYSVGLPQLQKRNSKSNKEVHWTAETPPAHRHSYVASWSIYYYHNICIRRDLSAALKVKSKGAIWLTRYGFSLVFNSRIGLTSAPLRATRVQNLRDLDCDLSRSNVIVPLDTILYYFLFVFNSNIWPNSAPLGDMSLHSLNDLDLTFQCHSRSKWWCNWTQVYDFPLVFDSNMT